MDMIGLLMILHVDSKSQGIEWFVVDAERLQDGGRKDDEVVTFIFKYTTTTIL
jgi:hypothetical protein